VVSTQSTTRYTIGFFFFFFFFLSRNSCQVLLLMAIKVGYEKSVVILTTIKHPKLSIVYSTNENS
jgi:hypothetical protein